MIEMSRAGDGIRTHDLLLGKETFYQLNHARVLPKIWSFTSRYPPDLAILATLLFDRFPFRRRAKNTGVNERQGL